MSSQWLVLLLVGSVAGLALMLSLRLLRVVTRLQQQVRNLQKKEEQGIPGRETASFSVSLGQAERRAEEAKVSLGGSTQADKYRYIASLADQGLDASGIAEALQMSAAEVEQLLRLARLRSQAQNVS